MSYLSLPDSALKSQLSISSSLVCCLLGTSILSRALFCGGYCFLGEDFIGELGDVS